MRTDPLNLEIESRELMEKQRGFQLINPTEKWFPGLDASRELFASWDWRIGKTPKFSVLKDVRLKSTGQEVDQQVGAAGDANLLKLKVDVVSVSNKMQIWIGIVTYILMVYQHTPGSHHERVDLPSGLCR